MKTWEYMRVLVKNEMNETGVKQKFIALRCNFDEKTFSQIVNGRKPITDIDIENFCNGMGVTPNDLLGFGNEKATG